MSIGAKIKAKLDERASDNKEKNDNEKYHQFHLVRDLSLPLDVKVTELALLEAGKVGFQLNPLKLQ